MTPDAMTSDEYCQQKAAFPTRAAFRCVLARYGI